MVLTVCFDALGTCFTLEPVIEALEELMGDELRPVGGARMIIMDWFHAAQRDYTYASITSPPPPPIATILKSTLPRSISFALQLKPSLTQQSPIPDLAQVYNQLQHLSPSSNLQSGFQRLSKAGAKVLIVTNGSKSTTQGYVDQAGLKEYVDNVKSCDEVGLGKPFGEVYAMAHRAVDELTGEEGREERWFVAAHMWDLHAAKKAGFKTGLVLFEQPPIKDGEVDQGWWDIYGGPPDVVGKDVEEVVIRILLDKQGM